MWNGFYKLDFKTKEELQEFFREALSLSCHANVDTIPPGQWSRTLDYNTTINEYIDNYLSLNTHNVCIDRDVYNQGKFGDQGEIGSSTLSSDSKYLFIYLSLVNLNKLVEKYSLKKLG